MNNRSFPLRWTVSGIALLTLIAATALSCGEDGGRVHLGYASDPPTASHDNVPTVTAKAGRLDGVLRLTGTLEANERSDIASTADGILTQVRVERGDLVEKGDVLALVDSRDANNALDQARANVSELNAELGWDASKGRFRVDNQPSVKAAKADMNLAKINLERFTNLFKSQAVSKQMLDQSRTQYELAQQKYQQARFQANYLYQSYNSALVRVKDVKKIVDQTTIRAPFSGWVATKFVSVGERVTTSPMGAGSKIVTLVSIDPMRLVLTVPQQDAAQVHTGQQVHFTVEALPGKTFSGHVKFVAPALEPGSRALTIEAIVSNPDKVLRPGFFVSAELTLPQKRHCVVIPATAIVKSGDVSTVYVLQDHQPVARIVALDETRDGRAYIKSGLAAGEKVITTPDKFAQNAGTLE